MLLRDHSEAEDAAQQTFLSAYRGLLAGSEPRYPAAWLATIARNECWGRIQQRMRQPLHEPVVEETAATTPGPLDTAIQRADLAALLTAIGELPRQQRDALLMREFSGLSYRELAQALSVSEPAVESLLVRARRELRVRLRPAYAACLAPVLFVRDLFSRLGAGGESTLGAVAKLASLPLAAKLAAGIATIGLVGGAVATGDRHFVEAVSAGTPQPVATRPSVGLASRPIRRTTESPSRREPNGRPSTSRPAGNAPAVAAIPGATLEDQARAGGQRAHGQPAPSSDEAGSGEDDSPVVAGRETGDSGDGTSDDQPSASEPGPSSGEPEGDDGVTDPAIADDDPPSAEDGAGSEPGDETPKADDDAKAPGDGLDD